MTIDTRDKRENKVESKIFSRGVPRKINFEIRRVSVTEVEDRYE